MKSFFLTLLYAMTYVTASLTGNFRLNTKDKQLILDLHNWYRAQVSRGDVHKQPEAADMTVVEWDDRLAEIAQHQAQYCRSSNKISQDLVRKQLLPLNNEVLGKLAMNEFITNETEEYFQKAIYFWFKNHIEFTYENGSCIGNSCQQYRNMIFSKTFILGCESHKCGKSRSVICVYANSEESNGEKPIYKSGLSCTSCPQDFSYCMDGSLCASKFHCRDSKIGKTCRCLVIPKICMKRGDFDSYKCRCRCQPGWTGLNCDKKCMDTSPMCDKRKWACTDPNHKIAMFKSCPQTCKWCQNNPSSIPIFNEHGLKINTIYDPTNFYLRYQADSSCKDTKMECEAWASKGYCKMESVMRVCKMTCNLCSVKQDSTTAMSSCVDHPTCVSDFEPYCNIMIQISMKCPKLCGRCKPTTSISTVSSTISTTHLLSTTTMPDIFSEGICVETPDRRMACESFEKANLCSNPNIPTFCPITCKHPSCIISPNINVKPVQSTTTQMSSTRISSTIESAVCKFLPCNSPGVPAFCANKCYGMVITTAAPTPDESPAYCNVYSCSISFVKIMCKKCFDPEICISLDCQYNGVPKLCKNKCQSTTPISTSLTSSHPTMVSSTAQTLTSMIMSTGSSTDSPICSWLPCASSNIMRICPMKCGTTSKMSTTTSSSSTPSTSSDSPLCSSLPCDIPRIELLCPVKCVKSTTLSSSSSTSTMKSTTSMTSDSPLCVTLPCYIPQIELVCPIKCPKSTTHRSTDPSLCKLVPCSIPQSNLMCPNKCVSTSTHMSSASMSSTSMSSTSMSSTSKSSSTATTKSTDSPLCALLPCSVPQANVACPNKCVSSTSTMSTKATDPPLCKLVPCSIPQSNIMCPNKCVSTSTSKSTSTATTKSSDSPLCAFVPCSIPHSNAACPNKCASSTSAMPTKASDLPLCALIPCNTPQSEIVCPNKCASSTTSKSTSTTSMSTKPTDPAFCASLPCQFTQAALICPSKCASTTMKSSTSAMSTKPTDLPLCAVLPCGSPEVQAICPAKCGSSSSASSSTMSIKSTDSPLCKLVPCSLPQSDIVCPNKCVSTSTSKYSSTATTKSTDPPICALVPCGMPQSIVSCPNKCASSTTTMSTKANDHPLCAIWLCSPEIVNLCPKKCSSTTMTSSSTAVTKPSDPPFCANFPCVFPQVQQACPVKCGSPTSMTSSTPTSSTMTTSAKSTPTKPTDFPMCILVFCDSIDAKMACPIKCGSSTSPLSTTPLSSTSTVDSKTDNPVCAQLPCSNAGVQALCKNKCASIVEDKPICQSLPCSNAGVRQLCVKKCADYTTSKSTATTSVNLSTTATTAMSSSTGKSTDPSLCLIFPCDIDGIKSICPKKCGSTTMATTKQADPEQCLFSNCDDFLAKLLCKVKCGG